MSPPNRVGGSRGDEWAFAAGESRWDTGAEGQVAMSAVIGEGEVGVLTVAVFRRGRRPEEFQGVVTG